MCSFDARNRGWTRLPLKMKWGLGRRAQWKINQPPSLRYNERAWKEMRGQTKWSPVLVQRAVSEDPRWTCAVGDQSSPPSREKDSGCSMRAGKGSLGYSRNPHYS